jgi:hypothetical protein
MLNSDFARLTRQRTGDVSRARGRSSEGEGGTAGSAMWTSKTSETRELSCQRADIAVTFYG